MDTGSLLLAFQFAYSQAPFVGTLELMTDEQGTRYLGIVEPGAEGDAKLDLDWISTGIDATIELDARSRFPTALNEAPQDWAERYFRGVSVDSTSWSPSNFS